MAKWHRPIAAPLSPKARQALDSYLGWLLSHGFETATGEPLFRSLLRNNYSKRLGYWGIYELVKDLAKASESTENIHPHRLRHTFGT